MRILDFVMEKYTCLIIEENTEDTNQLKELISSYNFLEIIGATQNLKEGLNLLNLLEPQILFLNFELNTANKSQLLEKVKKQPTIFFLIDDLAETKKTFEENGFRYIVKPFNQTQIKQSLTNFMQTHQQLATKMQALMGKLKL